MNATRRAARTKRLWIRLTPEEAAHLASVARARRLTLADFVRKAVFRGSGQQRRVRRRMVLDDTAGTIRQLSAIAAELHQLQAYGRANGTIPQDELRACLDQLRTVVGGITR
jgi:hypothetical protein